jgi:hypothetical protein
MALFVWPPQNINTTGLATEAKQDVIIAAIDGVETLITDTNSKLDTLNSTDFATSAKQDTIIGHIDGIEGALATLNAKDFATETTLQKLREWPYATWDKQALTEGATTDTWTYTSGVTTVGTITITYTDTGKGTIQDVAYSPVKAV